jgi:eukaryotic-like serine/threonine-protein kinase
MAGTRTGGDGEAQDLPAQAAGDDAHSRTTVRGVSPEQPTLRRESDQPALGGPPPWRSRYEDLGEIGRGGMSRVHLVFDRVIRRRVAMKVHDVQRDPAGLAHFLEEARITGQLDHPNVVAVHDVQYDAGGVPARFTMKLVEGETLAEVIARLGPAAVSGAELERLLGIVLKVCDAISFAHSRGVIHCDLKPSNVMVGSHGQVYVTDWGVALHRTQTAPRDDGGRSVKAADAGTWVGTPGYMAPEQARGRHDELDERTDVYGLGGILYALLTEQPPHDGGGSTGDLEHARRGEVVPPQRRAPERALPPGLCEIAMRALAPDPRDRYASVEALKRELERFLRGGGWFESVRLPALSTVLREGDAPDAAYVLVEGQCELYRSVLGKQRFVRTLGPGEVFGETAIFGSSTRTATVVASTDVTLVRVTKEALQRELDRTEWLRAFVQSLAERFIELDRHTRALDEG